LLNKEKEIGEKIITPLIIWYLIGSN